MNSALLLIGSGCLICLLPLALYFLFLAFLNNRRQPTLLSGVQDLTCLLLGLAGFFLIGGPVLLSAFDSTWRRSLLEGNFAELRLQMHGEAALWSFLAGGYVIAVAGAILLGMHARRRISVIYNFPAAHAEDLIARTLDFAGLRWRVRHGVFDIAPAGATADAGSCQLQVDVFAALSHVTLRWRDAPPALRRAVEVELARTLSQTAAPPNPAGSWFLSASVALFFVMLLWMVYLIFWMVRNP